MRGGPLASGSLAGRATASRAAQRWILGGHKLASERANWPLLTRPTVRGLPVDCSSTHAAGQKFGRAARRSGTSWMERALPCLSAGNVPVVGSPYGLYGGYATRRNQEKHTGWATRRAGPPSVCLATQGSPHANSRFSLGRLLAGRAVYRSTTPHRKHQLSST